MVLVEAFFRFNVKKLAKCSGSYSRRSCASIARTSSLLPVFLLRIIKINQRRRTRCRHLWRDAARFEIRHHRYCTLLHSWIRDIARLVARSLAFLASSFRRSIRYSRYPAGYHSYATHRRTAADKIDGSRRGSQRGTTRVTRIPRMEVTPSKRSRETYRGARR